MPTANPTFFRLPHAISKADKLAHIPYQSIPTTLCYNKMPHFTIPSQQSHMQPLPNAMKLFIAARENISTAVFFIHKPINTSLLCSKFLVVRFSENVSPFQIFLVNIGLVRGCSRYVSLWLAVLVNFGRLCCLF